MPVFNRITGKEISLHFDTETIFIFIGIVLFTGLLAGSYPALYLSKFNPHRYFERKITFFFC